MDWKRKCVMSQNLYISYEPMKFTSYTSMLWLTSTAHATMDGIRSKIALYDFAWDISSKW